MPRPVTWKSLAIVALSAAAVVVVGDLAAARLQPIRYQTEVEDALAAWREQAPTVLVIGSSHARTFDVVGEELARRTDRRERLVAVPVEFGKLTTYLFVLRERIAPLMARADEPPDQLILVTEWWDSTAPPGGGARNSNLPSRAWAFRHWAADVARSGFDPFNRNWVQERWRRLFRHSALVQDHGHGRVFHNLRRLLRGNAAGEIEDAKRERILSWHRSLENADILDKEQMAAFEEILDLVEEWGMEVTVLLYPRMPATLTAAGREGTLTTYRKEAERRVRARGHRFFELTETSPLRDEHFENDLDHVTPEGNRLFARWVLDGPLGFLVHSAGSGEAGAQE